MDHNGKPIGRVSTSEDSAGLNIKYAFDARQAARLYDVPPWIVSGDYPAPRYPRLRWMLRRVWPV
jgi:hypothetical protein